MTDPLHVSGVRFTAGSVRDRCREEVDRISSRLVLEHEVNHAAEKLRDERLRGPEMLIPGASGCSMNRHTPLVEPRSSPEAHTPILLSDNEAAALLGISARHLRSLHSQGRLGPLPIRLGRRRLWPLAELREWVIGGAPSRALWQHARGGGGS